MGTSCRIEIYSHQWHHPDCTDPNYIMRRIFAYKWMDSHIINVVRDMWDLQREAYEDLFGSDTVIIAHSLFERGYQTHFDVFNTKTQKYESSDCFDYVYELNVYETKSHDRKPNWSLKIRNGCLDDKVLLEETKLENIKVRDIKNMY
jgi:hypothetical protein